MKEKCGCGWTSSRNPGILDHYYKEREYTCPLSPKLGFFKELSFGEVDKKPPSASYFLVDLGPRK